MNKKSPLQKIILAACIVALAAAVLPLTSVFAAGNNEIDNNRLEAIWQKMQNRYARVGRMFDNDARLIQSAERMIERLEQEGQPTAELKAALQAYEDALKTARPLYESCKGILNSHKGFDASGKVTDTGQAQETVRAFGEKFAAVRNAMGGTGKTLAELMKSLRGQYRPAPATSP
ncbi:MAG: hypothetical protein HFACDABA_00455 [Anaerolineales bacterium]|nr:hypothetical protein [Anaerolineales bacterium]